MISDDWKKVYTSRDGRVRRAARRICRQFGIPTTDKRFKAPKYEVSFGWSGKALHFDPKTVSDSDLMHEIAHWLISDDRAHASLTNDFGYDEDIASLLGILLILPHHARMASWIAESHNWGDLDEVIKEFKEILTTKNNQVHRDEREPQRRLRRVVRELENLGAMPQLA